MDGSEPRTRDAGAELAPVAPTGSSRPMLTEQQRGFFARNGYLLVPGLIPDAACGHLVEQTWRRPPPSWSRDDPSSWTGDVTDSCHTASLKQRRGHLKYQGKAYGSDPVVESAFGRGSRLDAVAGDLIGHRLAEVLVRGLYVISPYPEAASAPSGCRPHVESHPPRSSPWRTWRMSGGARAACRSGPAAISSSTGPSSPNWSSRQLLRTLNYLISITPCLRWS